MGFSPCNSQIAAARRMCRTSRGQGSNPSLLATRPESRDLHTQRSIRASAIESETIGIPRGMRVHRYESRILLILGADSAISGKQFFCSMSSPLVRGLIETRRTRDRASTPPLPAVLKSLLLPRPCRTISAMDRTIAKELEDLPKASGVAVTTFVTAARQIFRDNLRSVVLFGSGAEGRLRPTSDINLVLVLSSFDPAKGTAFRSQFSYAESAGRLTAMFLLESEVASAVELFAQKFSDILRRHRVLYGPDPFAVVSIPRSAEIGRLRQVLLNLTLRLREAYVEYGATPERISGLIADSAGPIRSCAATLSKLEGKVAIPPKEALAEFVGSFGDGGWEEVLAHISETRERTLLSPDVADATVIRLIELTTHLRTRAEALR